MKEGTFSLANRKPLTSPMRALMASAMGMIHSPIFSMYSTHSSAESFMTLTTEKSKDPIMMTRVRPQAAMRK
jgi:hypothetical protein